MGEELRRLLKSGFVQDTLFQITGEPSEVREFSQVEGDLRDQGVVGEFDPERDRVALRGGRPRPETTRTLSHEAGHRLLDSLVKKIPAGTIGEQEQRLLTRQLPPQFDAVRNIEDPNAVQGHAGLTQHEHFATAFQRALHALRTPAGEGRQEQLQEAEREIPGAQAVADFLLGLPPFRN